MINIYTHTSSELNQLSSWDWCSAVSLTVPRDN